MKKWLLCFTLLLTASAYGQAVYGADWNGPAGLRSIPAGSTMRLGSPSAYVDANGNLTVAGATFSSTITATGPFGSSASTASSACETLYAPTTLSTGGTTTNTGLSCLPLNAIIDAVVYRVTTTIATATNFTIGDATIAARFCATQSTLVAGTTGVCFAQADQTGTSGPRQTAAAAVKITTTGTPSAGAIRFTVYYHTWAAPTS